MSHVIHFSRNKTSEQTLLFNMAKHSLASTILILSLMLATCFAKPIPQHGLFGGFFGGSGTGAGAGTGNAGPGGVSASGIAISSAQNGGFGTASGSGSAFSSPFGVAGATGTGSGFSFGK